MTTKNPFPGMNPFFEQRWRDAHTRLIAYLCDALQERLPDDLVAGAEEEVVAIGAGEFRPDLQVRQPPAGPGGKSEQLTTISSMEVTATEPIRVFVDDDVERWIEIRDETGKLVTVLELLSPSNKNESWERDRYQKKCRTFISGGTNLVEIDLVRQGQPVHPRAMLDLLQRSDACYAVSVFRAAQPAERELYPIRLEDRLPAIRVPLRPTDSDLVLDLQPLIDQCHERGRYHRLDYNRELRPPLQPEAAAWVERLLCEHGLR